MLCCSQTFAPVAARFLPRPAKTVTKCFRCHLWQTDKWRVAVETGTDMNHRKRHLQICVKSRFHITSTMKNYLSQNHKNNVQIYDTSIVPQKRDVLRHLFWFPAYFRNTHMCILHNFVNPSFWSFDLAHLDSGKCLTKLLCVWSVSYTHLTLPTNGW